MEFKLRSEYIELDNLLKVLELSPTVKAVILEGRVKVNGQVEKRVRRKLKSQDSVEFGGKTITIKPKEE